MAIYKSALDLVGKTPLLEVQNFEKEYIEKVASPFTAAACGAVDDIFAPADTRAKVISALDILAGRCV